MGCDPLIVSGAKRSSRGVWTCGESGREDGPASGGMSYVKRGDGERVFLRLGGATSTYGSAGGGACRDERREPTISGTCAGVNGWELLGAALAWMEGEGSLLCGCDGMRCRIFTAGTTTMSSSTCVGVDSAASFAGATWWAWNSCPPSFPLSMLKSRDEVKESALG